METELDGRFLALRQAVALAVAMSTRGNEQATALALELLGDLRAGMDDAPDDSPFPAPPWVAGAQDELDAIARLVRAFTQAPADDADE